MPRDRHHDANNDETNVWPGSLPIGLLLDNGAQFSRGGPSASPRALPISPHREICQIDHDVWEFFGRSVSLHLRFPQEGA
jgi:hypothetical protein